MAGYRDTERNAESRNALAQATFFSSYGAVYCLSDVLDCLAGTLIEPKNSGRRVALALEVEIALKQSSAQKGLRVDLPLADHSLGLYDWFR